MPHQASGVFFAILPLVLELFLLLSMKKESYLKTSNWAESSHCELSQGSLWFFYISFGKRICIHMSFCLFCLSVLTCLSLISLIFWITKSNFIHKIWLFSFPGTCLISYGHMCRWELKLLHQLNHFCFSVLLYFLSEIVFSLFCPQETWLLSLGHWLRHQGLLSSEALV